MAFNVTRKHGRDLEFEQIDLLTGLLLQDPTNQNQQEDMGGTDIAGGADAINTKSSFGTPFVIETVINAEETGGAATGVLTAAALTAGDYQDVFPTYDSDATARTTGSPFKFKIISAMVVVLDENIKSATDTIQIMHVATDLTTETAITNAMGLNLDDDLIVVPTTYDQDACVIDIGENIRFDVVLENSAATESRNLKVYIFAMRCVADE